MFQKETRDEITARDEREPMKIRLLGRSGKGKIFQSRDAARERGRERNPLAMDKMITRLGFLGIAE